MLKCPLPALKCKLENVKEEATVTVCNAHAVYVLRKAKTTAKTTGLRQRFETGSTQTSKSALLSAANFSKERKMTSCRKQQWHEYIKCLFTSFLTYLLTPWCSLSSEANRFSPNQEIPRILWDPKDHNCIYKCPPHVPNLIQINPIHAPTSHFLKIYLIIILPSTPESSRWTISVFSHQNPVYTSTLSQMCYMSCPFNSSRFDHPKNNGRGVQIIKLLIMSLSPRTS
jgi:hypothetical protein